MAVIMKTGKSLHLSNGSIYRRQIWYDDRQWSYLPYRPFKFPIFKNTRWQPATISKLLSHNSSVMSWPLQLFTFLVCEN